MRRRDLVVVGGGAAGIVATAAAASLGARTTLVEAADRLGGECSWTGCVPSKTLIHLAGEVHALRARGARAAADDLAGTALADTRRITSEIARDAGTQSMLERMGAEVRFGDVHFLGAHRAVIDGETHHVRRAILATGSAPRMPGIPGLRDAPFVTNRTLFDLPSVPPRLVILGAGPIGIEMAQAFQRLGSRVTVVGRSDRILPHDDAELAGSLEGMLREEGIQFELGATGERVESVAGGGVRVHYRRAGDTGTVVGDRLLVATGRQANVANLGLETIGLESDDRGLDVDERMRTRAGWLLGAGDVVGRYQFSHVAEHEAIAAVRNAFFPLPQRVRYRRLPWCTFTDPELAHFGPTESELARQGVRHRVYRFDFAHEDRARTEGRGRGRVKLIATPGGRLIAGHILGPRAGELINELVIGEMKGATLADLALAVHVYPTLNLGIQRAADFWLAERGETPWIRWLASLFTRRAGGASLR